MNMTENGKEWFFLGKSLLKKRGFLKILSNYKYIIEVKCNEV